MLYKTLALSTFLFGTVANAADPACYATFSSSKSYTDSDPVSRISYVTTELKCCTKTVTCAGGTSGCSSSTSGVDGTKKVGCTTEGTDGCTCTDNGTTDTYNNPACKSTESEVSTKVANNYDCKEQVWCNDAGRQPGTQYEDTAWTKVEVCDTSLPTATPAAPALWNSATPGCPEEWESGESYAKSSIATFVDSNGFKIVYQCADDPNHLFCGYDAYNPITGQSNLKVWESLGSCDGTVLALSDYPGFEDLPDEGGCPDEYEAGEDYVSGDRVSRDGLVYECVTGANGLHCPQAGYEPGEGTAFADAWTVVGTCEGTIGPTSSPSFDALELVGGCPDEWEVKAEGYEEGDIVSALGDGENKLVFECGGYPQTGHCGQAGYEPGIEDIQGVPAPWKGVWTVVGYCSGSIGPTSSPTFDELEDIGSGCPGEWEGGTNTAYEEGDMVSVEVSDSPPRSIVYKCKAWPYSGFCGQLSPTVFGGDQGWKLFGSCLGSVGPTSSPTFDKLDVDTDGCPQEWSASTKDYEAGELVSYTVSKVPERKIVYKCRDWPNSGYCNQGSGFEPTTQYASMAWTLIGACSGTLAPTTSPTKYTGTCEYVKKVVTQTTESCTNGQTGCKCNGASPPVCQREVDVTTPTPTPVDNGWQSGKDYVAGDVIRIGLDRYECREWPNYLWCRQSAYNPATAPQATWSQAWTTDGQCPAAP